MEITKEIEAHPLVPNSSLALTIVSVKLSNNTYMKFYDPVWPLHILYIYV